jgi:hypothetical protein
MNTMPRTIEDRKNNWNWLIENEFDHSKSSLGDLTFGSSQKVWWICSKCNHSWEAVISNRCRGSGCLKCMNKERDANRERKKEEFKIKAKKIHGDRYSYDIVNYKNNKEKVEIVCHIHGVFKQRISNHLSGQGCPKCHYLRKSNL